MKYLIVGDVHATRSELRDCEKLTSYVANIAKQEHINKIVFMGDIYNTHSVLDLYVVNFWRETFTYLKQYADEIIVIVGNHDQADSKNSSFLNAVSMHENAVTVVSYAKSIDDILYVPYMADNAKFIQVCNNVPENIIFCHQTFNGSQYENGFYAKDGVDPNLLKAKIVISGHIHSAQKFGKIEYIGSPRWRTASDANQKKSLWVLDIKYGNIINRQEFPTDACCTSIIKLTDTQNNPISPYDLELNNKDFIIDIIGTKDYIQNRVQQLSRKNVKIRTHVEQKTFQIRESDGINNAFNKYFQEYICKNNINQEELYKLVKERVSWIQ